MNLYDTIRPEGFGTVNSYLFSDDPQKLIEFLKDAFYAEETSRTVHPEEGFIQNCILKIGDSCIMIAQARDQFIGMKSSLYFYTSDVDHLYQRALDHGANSVFAPADMDYGDRSGGIQDPCGNYWWISKRLQKGDYN